VIIPNVPNEKLPALLSEPLLSEWSPYASAVMRGLVTCTGKDYCHFALNDTKGYSLAIARQLEQRFPQTEQVISLNISGCIHACARHRSTELGLQATRIRLKSGEIVDGFDIFEGGHVGHTAQLGKLIQKRATVEQTVELLSQKIAKKYSLS
jgi:ferredoxin-nitrite reductase